jgi:2-polyprenyl-3-methyl-5-hydroxy-6-metoxy-1,4-benzoquinol methylase
MEDEVYVETSEVRRQQSVQLFKQVQKVGDFSSWLDIGAGVGELVDVVSQFGLRAIGIEPSQFLSNEARKLRRNVLTGSLEVIPNQKFDVISVIDVIEHVVSPLQFIGTLIPYLSPNGVIVIVTPDSDSAVAKLLKHRWWHIRPAHISYFSKKTLRKCIAHLSLEELAHFRPSWYFPGSYLSQRLGKYLRKFTFIIRPISLLKMIKVNPRDSIGVIVCVKK